MSHLLAVAKKTVKNISSVILIKIQ